MAVGVREWGNLRRRLVPRQRPRGGRVVGLGRGRGTGRGRAKARVRVRGRGRGRARA